MRLFCLIIFLLFFSFVSHSQGYLGAKREKCQQRFWKYCADNNLQCEVFNNDSLLLFRVNDSSQLPEEVVLQFNKKNRCFIQKTTVECNDCFHRTLESILGRRCIKWRKIRDRLYVSKLSYAFLEVTGSNEFVMEKLAFNEFMPLWKKIKPTL